jgi:hypothetical protein
MEIANWSNLVLGLASAVASLAAFLRGGVPWPDRTIVPG